MFELILNRFAIIGREGAELLSAEELATWPGDDVAALKRLNLVKKATPAKDIECPGCEEACLMPVNVHPTQDDRPARIFIACDKREDTGRILIPPSDLEQWQVDMGRFVSLLASALDTGHIPDEIIQRQAFYLGTLTINRKRWSTIFIGNNETLNSSLEKGLFEQYPLPFFLVAADLHGPQKMKQGQAIPLSHVLQSSGASLSVDQEELKKALSVKSNSRQDVIPIQVPADTDWNQVFISFVNELTVQIKIAGTTEHRSFDEMGFSDLRAQAAESQPTSLWGIFRQLATLNGEMTFQDSVKSFNDPEKMKKWVSLIRKKLQQVLPNIPGDPFFPYRKENSYKSRFSLNLLPSAK